MKHQPDPKCRHEWMDATLTDGRPVQRCKWCPRWRWPQSKPVPPKWWLRVLRPSDDEECST